MPYPVWLTTNEIIGTIPENSFYSYQLSTTEIPGKPVTFTIISGTFPPGINLEKSTGKLHGIATIPRNVGLDVKYSYTATVRAAFSQTEISDRTFRIDVNSIVRPIIIPSSGKIGDYLAEHNFYYRFNLANENTFIPPIWTHTKGTLPPGLTFTQNGELAGVLSPQGFEITVDINGNTVLTPVTIEHAQLDYSFGIQVFDGFTTVENIYTMTVTTNMYVTADVNILVSDNYLVTADVTSTRYPPVITNVDHILPTVRHQTDFLFQIIALNYSFQNEPVTFHWVGYGTTSFVPSGLTLDATTGWITGHIVYHQADTKTYSFTVIARKIVDGIDVDSLPVTFTLTVLGAIDNILTWITPTDLGTVYNGDVCELQLLANASSMATLQYSMSNGTYNKLPNGIKLNSDGLLVGRFPFNHFTLDNKLTTIDKNSTTIDSTFTFTASVDDYYNNLHSEKTFNFRILNRYDIPYENLYINALLPTNDRTKFTSILESEDYFPTSLIYRLSDTNFGKATDIKFLFLPGIDPSNPNEYAALLKENHYTKRIQLGDIKTAIATDANLNIKYEVVYVEVLDVNNTNKILSTANPYYGKTGEVRNITPNSFNLMQHRIADNLTYANKGALPDWMTTRQQNGTVLGLTYAVILAYTQPNASKLIAYRLQNSSITFNSLSFDTDRYTLDNFLSSNFNLATNKFIPAKETSFDRIDHIAVEGNFTGDILLGSPNISNVSTINSANIIGFTVIGSGIPDNTYIVSYDPSLNLIILNNNSLTTRTNISLSIIPSAGSVEFATNTPYELIHNRSVDFISSYGGFDLSNSYKDGDTLIFYRQEHYTTTNSPALSLVADTFDNSNFDMVAYSAGQAIIELGNLTNPTSLAAGWYDTAYPETVVGDGPAVWGYNSHILNSTHANRRMGIWRINISTSNIVTLTYVRDVIEWQYVTVVSGTLFKDTKIYFNPVIDTAYGFTVPSWTVMSDRVNNSSQFTTFDLNATRFYNNRNVYADMNRNSVYVKFQQNVPVFS